MHDHQTGPLGDLESAVAELREGQHELLRMYEELRERCPRTCWFVQQRERARQELRAFDPLEVPRNHEDYQPE